LSLSSWQGGGRRGGTRRWWKSRPAPASPDSAIIDAALRGPTGEKLKRVKEIEEKKNRRQKEEQQKQQHIKPE